VGQDLERQLGEIKRGRRTGSLTIGFEQGRPAGEFAWKERLKIKQGPYALSEVFRAHPRMNACAELVRDAKAAD
jgi:hypothetical protein